MIWLTPCNRASLHSVEEWKRLHLRYTNRQVCVLWSWMYIFLHCCGCGWNHRTLMAMFNSNTSELYIDMKWDDLTTQLGALIFSLSSDDGGVYILNVHTIEMENTLKESFFLFLFVFFLFYHFSFFNLGITQSLTYTKGDAMMLYSHNAHQNTSPKIRALY